MSAKQRKYPVKEPRPHPGARGFIDPRPEERIDPAATYTIEETAAHLRISRRAVNGLIDSGRIGFVPINERQRRVLGRQILDFLDRTARGPIR
jgi:excisionase family DNA binding protein